MPPLWRYPCRRSYPCKRSGACRRSGGCTAVSTSSAHTTQRPAQQNMQSRGEQEAATRGCNKRQQTRGCNKRLQQEAATRGCNKRLQQEAATRGSRQEAATRGSNKRQQTRGSRQRHESTCFTNARALCDLEAEAGKQRQGLTWWTRRCVWDGDAKRRAAWYRGPVQ